MGARASRPEGVNDDPTLRIDQNPHNEEALQSAAASTSEIVSRKLAQFDEDPGVVLCGFGNSGKSSLFNAIYGKDVQAVSMQTDLTRNAFTVRVASKFCLTDTPGFGTSRFNLTQIVEHLNEMQCIVHVLNGTSAISEEDDRFYWMMRQRNMKVIIAVNKRDLLTSREQTDVAQCVKTHFGLEPFNLQHVFDERGFDPLRHFVFTSVKEKRSVELLIGFIYSLLPPHVQAAFVAEQTASLQLKKVYARSTIVSHALIAGVIGALPIPLYDLLLVSPIQLVLVLSLARIFNIGLSADEAAHVIATMGTGVGLRVLSQTLVTVIVPGLGSALTAAVAFCSTFALGETTLYMFAGQGTTSSPGAGWQSINQSRIRPLYDEIRASAKAQFERHTKWITRRAKSITRPKVGNNSGAQLDPLADEEIVSVLFLEDSEIRQRLESDSSSSSTIIDGFFSLPRTLSCPIPSSPTPFAIDRTASCPAEVIDHYVDRPITPLRGECSSNTFAGAASRLSSSSPLPSLSQQGAMSREFQVNDERTHSSSSSPMPLPLNNNTSLKRSGLWDSMVSSLSNMKPSGEHTPPLSVKIPPLSDKTLSLSSDKAPLSLSDKTLSESSSHSNLPTPTKSDSSLSDTSNVSSPKSPQPVAAMPSPGMRDRSPFCRAPGDLSAGYLVIRICPVTNTPEDHIGHCAGDLSDESHHDHHHHSHESDGCDGDRSLHGKKEECDPSAMTASSSWDITDDWPSMPRHPKQSLLSRLILAEKASYGSRL